MRLDNDEHVFLRTLAAERGISMSAYVEELVQSELRARAAEVVEAGRLTFAVAERILGAAATVATTKDDEESEDGE